MIPFASLTPQKIHEFLEPVSKKNKDAKSVLSFELLFEAFEKSLHADARTVSYNKTLGMSQFDDQFILVLTDGERNDDSDPECVLNQL